jgi:tetratricopeptide (TPR) repeat protein
MAFCGTFDLNVNESQREDARRAFSRGPPSPMPHEPNLVLSIRKHIDQAAALQAEKKFSEALAAVQPALESNGEQGEHESVPQALRAEALNIAAACSMAMNRFDDAERYWRQCTEASPDFAEAYHHLGMLLKSLKRTSQAAVVYRKLQELRPDVAEVHNNLGSILHDLRYLLEAETAYRQAIAIRPDYAQAHFNLAVALHELRRLHDAESSYRAAIAARADFAEAHGNLGNVLGEQGRLLEADAAYRQALLIRPDNPVTLNNLGSVLQALNRLPDAELAFRLATTIRVNYPEAHANLGAVLMKLQRLPEAEAAFRQAIAFKPDYAEAFYHLGNVLFVQKRLPEAEAAYVDALRHRANLAEAHHNLGCVLEALDRLPDAVDHFQTALTLRPNYPEAQYNLASVLKRLKRFPGAEAAFRQALALRPGYPDAKFYLGTLLLGMGQYDEGWALYESRYEHPGFAHHNSRALLRCPQWHGEDLTGKSLLIWQEDGLGDMIQFARYLPLLKARGAAHITFACAPVLHRLMAHVDGIDAIVDQETALAEASRFDCWTSLLSAPFHMRTTVETIPSATRFTPEPALIEQWRVRLDELPRGRKIGLVWKGNPLHHNDVNRSLPSLATLASLWTLPDVSFVSLQKGQGEDEAQHPPTGQPLLNLGSEVTDFADSAAIISQLDLVVCVDTSIAHLAASLGKPCWILLPGNVVDWRWMQGRDDSPWYPQTVRLFRRAAGESWMATVERVREAWSTHVVALPEQDVGE